MTNEEKIKIFDNVIKVLKQEPCEDCKGNGEDNKATFCQKSYLAGMEHYKPCEDAISRAKAIDTMKHWFSDMLETGKEEYSIDDVLNSLSSVTPTQRWIPVTEDAPPIGTICLWCNKQGSVFVSEITYRSEKFSYVGQHGYFCNGLKNHGNIVAWQPLPKPYKPGSEGK